MRRALLALLIAVGATLLGYALLAAVGAVAGGWSAETLRDQAIGLAFHAGVSLARGVVPTVLATAAAVTIVGGVRGSAPGALAVAGLALGVAAAVTATALTMPLGGFPRLEIHGALNASATVAVLAAVAAASLLGAGRALRARDRRPES